MDAGATRCTKKMMQAALIVLLAGLADLAIAAATPTQADSKAAKNARIFSATYGADSMATYGATTKIVKKYDITGDDRVDKIKMARYSTRCSWLGNRIGMANRLTASVGPDGLGAQAASGWGIHPSPAFFVEQNFTIPARYD